MVGIVTKVIYIFSTTWFNYWTVQSKLLVGKMEKLASSTSNLGFISKFSEKSISIYLPSNAILIIGKTYLSRESPPQKQKNKWCAFAYWKTQWITSIKISQLKFLNFSKNVLHKLNSFFDFLCFKGFMFSNGNIWWKLFLCMTWITPDLLMYCNFILNKSLTGFFMIGTSVMKRLKDN